MQSDNRRFLMHWLLATTAGWVLGIILIVVLAMLSDLLGVEGQFIVGIGMGLGVGISQWLVARRWFGATSAWMWSSTVGMAAPFLVCDVMRVRVEGDSLIIAAGVGGLLVGAWQRRTVARRMDHGNWWVLSTPVAWLVATVAFLRLASQGHPSDAWETFRSIAAIPLSGLALATITGGTLLLMFGAWSPAKNPAETTTPHAPAMPASTPAGR